MGFSSREYWSGLPFPSPVHEKKSESEVQSCLTLRDPMDCSLPGSSVHGIFQARTLESVAISFSSAWKWKVKVKSLSHVWLFATPWTAAYQAPPSMGFFRQEYWSGVPLPSPNPWSRGTQLRCLVTFPFYFHSLRDSALKSFSGVRKRC